MPTRTQNKGLTECPGCPCLWAWMSKEAKSKQGQCGKYLWGGKETITESDKKGWLWCSHTFGRAALGALGSRQPASAAAVRTRSLVLLSATSRPPVGKETKRGIQLTTKTMSERLGMQQFKLLLPFFLTFILSENMKWAQMSRGSLQKWGTKWSIRRELNSAGIHQPLFRKQAARLLPAEPPYVT